MKNIERFGVLSIVIAVMGILAPIGWEWYRTRTALEVQLLRSSTIAATTQGVDKLRFVYDSVEVPNLSRIEVVITNTGRTPIVGAQFVAPLILAIDNGQVLDLGVSRTEPDGISLRYSLSADRKRIQLSAPLLNPGDAAYLTLLTSSAIPALTVSGRIVGVRAVSLNDRREPLITRPAPRLTWSFYVVGAVTLLILLLLILVLYMQGGETALEKATKAGLIHLPKAQSAGTLAAMIAALKEFATPETVPALDLLGQLQPDTILSDEKTLEVEASLREGLANMTGLWPLFVILVILSSIGYWYVLRRFF